MSSFTGIEEQHIPAYLDTYHAEIKINKTTCNIEIYDIGSSVDHEHVLPLIIPGTSCVLMCYNVVDANSLKSLTDYWHPKMTEYNEDFPYIICGNKLDLKYKFPDLYITNEAAQQAFYGIENFKSCHQCSALEEMRKNESFAGFTRLIFRNVCKEAYIFEGGAIPRSNQVVVNCTLF